MNIEEILNRRSDLSTFLVHLTRDFADKSAVQNLESILDGRVINARTPLGAASRTTPPTGARDQRVVCFSETPLEHIWTLCAEIPGRSARLEPYGLVFTKAHARRIGVNPVWYTDITPGHDWIMKSVNALLRHASAQPRDDPTHDIYRLTPFMEQMGNPSGRRKEFWWEREWRHVGDFPVSIDAVVAVLAPANQHTRILKALKSTGTAHPPAVLDPRWSPERMVARLSGIETDAGSFPD